MTITLLSSHKSFRMKPNFWRAIYMMDGSPRKSITSIKDLKIWKENIS